MNDIGILTRIDALGRIVIPKNIRDRYNLAAKVELIMTKDGILIKSPSPSAQKEKTKQ